MEDNSETEFNDENDIAYEHYSDEEYECDQIKRKHFNPQCIIDSDSNSGDEHSHAIKQEPQTIDLNESIENPENCIEMGGDVSDMVQSLLQSRPPGISTLQCSECDLECPSLQALEFHTKLHVMERIVQSSFNYPGIGLKSSPDKINKHKVHADNHSNVEKKPLNQQNSSIEKIFTHIDEANDIETIMKSLISQGTNKDMSYRGSGSDHSDEKPHNCNECGFGFTSTKDLKRHMQTHTCKKNKKPKSRKIKRKNPRSKKNKKKSPQNNDINPADKKTFKCEECGSRFRTKLYFEGHMLTHSTSECSQNPKGKIIKIRVPKIDDKNSDKKPFKCKECNTRFKTKHYFEGHMLTHLTSKCTLCEYRCSKKGQLTRHMLTHTDTKPYECPACDYKCNEKGNLAKHMVIHGDDRPFSCPKEGCDYKCKLKYNLNTHMLKHSGERPFQCHLCDYTSITKGSLNTHLFKHSGEKPFSCSFCGNRYAMKGDLNIHKRIHTNNKKFECQLCDYRGYTKQRINQHMLTHTGEKPHECYVCGSRFTSTSNLKKHLQTHGIFNSISVKSSQLSKDLPNHSENSNASSQIHQVLHQGNTQPVNNQSLLGTNSIMGRSSQETTHPDVNYKLFPSNMDYHSLSKIYNNFPPSAKPLWHQGSTSLPAVNNDGYNCQALIDKLQYYGN